MIDRNQANQTGMLRTVLAHLNTHPEVLTAITFLATLKTMVGTNIEGLDDIAAGAGATEGVTENKDTARREAIRLGVPIAAAVKAQANFVGNAELRVKVDYSKSDLEGFREENYLPIIEGIATEAQALAADLVGRAGLRRRIWRISCFGMVSFEPWSQLRRRGNRILVKTLRSTTICWARR